MPICMHNTNAFQVSPLTPLPFPSALECFVLPLAISAFSVSDRAQGWAKGRSKLIKGCSLCWQFQYDAPCSQGFSISPILQHLPSLPSFDGLATAPALTRVLPDTLPCSPPLGGEFGHKPTPLSCASSVGLSPVLLLVTRA